jgi:hypothetical protein
MECTQRLDFSDDDDEQLDDEAFRKRVYGRFLIAGADDGDKSFDIFGGENKIGRDADQSNIALDTRVRLPPPLVINFYIFLHDVC